jgi:hypothetical protein
LTRQGFDHGMVNGKPECEGRDEAKGHHGRFLIPVAIENGKG